MAEIRDCVGVLWGRLGNKLNIPGKLYINTLERPSVRLGVGRLDIRPKRTDPPLQTYVNHLEPTVGQIIPIPNGEDINRCIGNYQTDMVSLIDFSDYEQDEYDKIFIGRNNECFDLENILTHINNKFSNFDQQSFRVVPSYPTNFINQPIPPRLLLQLKLVI